MKLRWTPHACADLEAIYEYIAGDSSQNAAHMIERLLDRAEGMVAFLSLIIVHPRVKTTR